MALTIEEIAIPEAVGASGWETFAELGRLQVAVERDAYGTDEFSHPPEEALSWFHDPDEPIRVLAARRDGRIVGRASVESRLGDGAAAAWLEIDVPAAERGAGVEDALADAAEELARAAGADRALLYLAIGADDAAPRLVPASGVGSVPETDVARFLLGRGYRLEQVYRGSRFVLPASVDLDAALAAAEADAGPAYRVVLWREPTPSELRDGFADLMTRMSTDIPTAGLDEPEDVWDAARVLSSEAVHAAAPDRRLVAAIVHEPTGVLAGFTRVIVPDDLGRPVLQAATLVRREHRGHRLGMLLKVANLGHLADAAPGHPSVVTWNAEENRHMLAVNEALGFTALGYSGAFRKDLS